MTDRERKRSCGERKLYLYNQRGGEGGGSLLLCLPAGATLLEVRHAGEEGLGLGHGIISERHGGGKGGGMVMHRKSRAAGLLCLQLRHICQATFVGIDLRHQSLRQLLAPGLLLLSSRRIQTHLGAHSLQIRAIHEIVVVMMRGSQRMVAMVAMEEKGFILLRVWLWGRELRIIRSL
jgi:hypothetical protein